MWFVTDPAGPNLEPLSRRGAFARVALGMAQLFGAIFAAALLYDTGINRWSLLAVVLTCAFTTASVLLFGKR